MKNTLIKNFKHHPEWCKKTDRLTSYKEFKLGEVVIYNKDLVTIIHIGIKVYKDLDTDMTTSFRLLLPSGASYTGFYEYIKKS